MFENEPFFNTCQLITADIFTLKSGADATATIAWKKKL